MSTDREAERIAFLQSAGLGHAVRTPLAGDASTRRYERLTRPDGSTLIFMDQPPAEESAVAPPDASEEERRALGYNAEARLAGGSVAAFVALAGWLRAQGLSAPRVEADGARWALNRYDALAYHAGLDPFLDWWPKFAGLPAPSAEAQAEWTELWAPLIALGEPDRPVFTHRDYHAENLLWLPEREGLARVGMLDFQDAVAGHPAWDLLHLLQDARRDVPPELEAAMLDRYLAARPETDREEFLHDYRALAALNAARILGRVFARQEVLFRRDRYTAFMPRTWRHLERNLGRGDMEGLRAWFDQHIPPEARAAENRS